MYGRNRYGTTRYGASGAEAVAEEGFALAPGETAIIDHLLKTVTIDGVNALKDWSSTFFDLPPGAWKVVYMDSEDSRDLTVTVAWKDKWI